jgi:hypothetical protein
MTIATCVFCGEEKFGALTRCKSCKRRPETVRDVARSMYFCDRHQSIEELKDIGAFIKAIGRPPKLPLGLEVDLQNAARATMHMVGLDPNNEG